MGIVLTTSVPGLFLRQLEVEDASAVAGFHGANADRLLRYSPGDGPPPTDEASVREMITSDSERDLLFGLWLDDVFLGVQHLLTFTEGEPPTCLASVGYGIDAPYEGRGYVAAAVVAMLSYARADLGATAARVLVAEANGRSRRLLERLGFGLVSADGGWLRYGRQLGGS